MAQDIIDGLIQQEFDTTEVFNRLYAGHKLFKNFPFDEDRYKRRIKSLQAIIARTKHWAQYDDQALAQDLLVYPPQERNSVGMRRWHGSEAEGLLKLDIQNGVHLQHGRPKFLWLSRQEYQLFPLTVFRKHIDQNLQENKEFGRTPGQARHHRRKVGNPALRRADSATDAS